ncbi:RNA-dependent DNA polymerase [Pycnococcus provasolii]
MSRLPKKARRQRGARMLVYMDDFLLMAKTKKETTQLRDKFTELAAELGLSLQREKCVWEPTRRLVHLGLVVDSEKGLFQVDEVKAAKCRALANGAAGGV